MAKLKEEIKLYIVQQLACFSTPSQVSRDVFEEFGIKVERMAIQVYDPTKAAGVVLSQKYKNLFYSIREKFLEKIQDIPIALKAVRLQRLERSYIYFIGKNNHVAANQVIEQAAKEDGGYYTNKIKVGGDIDNQLSILLRQVSGTSLPIIHDVKN